MTAELETLILSILQAVLLFFRPKPTVYKADKPNE